MWNYWVKEPSFVYYLNQPSKMDLELLNKKYEYLVLNKLTVVSLTLYVIDIYALSILDEFTIEDRYFLNCDQYLRIKHKLAFNKHLLFPSVNRTGSSLVFLYPDQDVKFVVDKKYRTPYFYWNWNKE
jgi:hypothetical protein